MLKKLLTIGLVLLLWTGAKSQATISESDVQFWVGTGTNSTLVCIGWDDATASYTPTVVVWGVHWNGSIHLIDALDSIATYDERFTYNFGSSGFLNWVQYNDPDEGLTLTPSGYNCNNYGMGYGSGTLGSTWLRISTSTCSNYDFTNITNVVYASDPNAVYSCQKAQSLSVVNIRETSATVNILDTTYVNDYTVMLYAADSLVDSTVVYTQTLSYSTLTANTPYMVQVFSNCSDGTQTSARTATFRTPCVSVAHSDLPWTEDFQSYNGLSYSSSSVSFVNQVYCWDLKNPYSTSDPYINSSSSVNAAGGKCLYVSSRPTNPTILVLPPFDDSPDGLQLSFDVLSTYRHGFEVGIMTDIAFDSTFTPIATCLPDGSGWTHFDVTFAGFTQGRLALRSNDNGPAYLDNVTVSELPACVRPSQVLVSNVTASSADITITDPNASNHYMVYAAGDSVEIYSNSHTLTNLLPNMRYEVSVRTLCADTVTGTTESAFRTSCGIISVPYHEDFSQFADVSRGFGYAVVDSTLPCWGFLKARSLDRLEIFPPSQSSTYGYGDDGYTMRIYGNFSNSTDIVVLPEFDQDINSLEISFMARPSENGSFGGSLQIGYLTTPSDTNSFVSVSSYASSQFTSGFDLCTGIFLNAPTGARIALRYLPSGGSAKSWYIDEIDVHEMPACVRAQGVRVDSILTDGFTLYVADPTAVNHYRYYLSTNATIDSADFYDTVTTITGLTASTDYELQVVSICDDGTLTLPHTISVSTLCGPVTEIPFVENFDNWTATQSDGMDRCWNRLYMNSSSRLVTNNYPYCATGSANAYTGFKSLKMYSKGISNDIKEYSVAYLPEFEANLNTLKVSFFYKYGGTTYNINKVRIAVGVSDSVSDTASFTRLATLTPSVIGWNEFEVDLSAYTGTGRRITIMQTSTGTTAITSYIDSLLVDTISSCSRPATLVASNVTAYGATLTWTDPSQAGSYLVRWSDGTTSDSVTVSNDSTYTLSGLTPSTSYTVDISSICWGHPTNARSTTFVTSCAPMPLPWSMNFDNITSTSQLSSCWNRYSGRYLDTASVTLSASTSGWTRSTTAFDGSSHFKVNIYGTNCKYWLVTPEINLSQNATLTFDYMLTDYNNSEAPETTGTGFADDRFVVLATTDGENWTALAKWGSDSSRDDYPLSAVTNIASQASISLSAFTGQNVRLAFYGESTVSGADNDLRIDNLLVSVATPDTTQTPDDPTADTLCSTVQTLPYSIDFSGYVDNHRIRPFMAGAAKPDCWTLLGNGTTQYVSAPNDSSATYFGGIGYSTSTNSFGAIAADNAYLSLIASQIYTGSDPSYIAEVNAVGTRRYAVLPAFDQPLSQTVLSFDHRTNYIGAQLIVGYILTDTSSFVGIDTLAADNRVLHHDTIAFSHYTTMPTSARLAFLWNVTSSTSSVTGPGYRYCGIDNLAVALSAADTTTPADTTVIPTNPVDATIAFSDILYWVGSGSDSAVFIVNYAQPDTAFAWGYLFNGSTTAQTMVSDIDAADPRLTVTGSPSMGGDIRFTLSNGDTLGLSPAGAMGYNFWWTNLNGVSAGAGAGSTLHNGDVFKYGDLNSAIGWDPLGTYYLQEAWVKAPTPVPVPDTTGTPEPPALVDATVSFSDITCWAGSGSDSTALIVSFANPDTAFAWGVLINAQTTAESMLNAVLAVDTNLSITGHPDWGDGQIRYRLSDGTIISRTGTEWIFNIDGVDSWGDDTVWAGSVFKFGDRASGILTGEDAFQRVWTAVPTIVDFCTTDTIPTPVEATIAASDILFWVGTGSNQAVMAVNWADTALAWGYRFDGEATVADMLADIAATDPRFSYVGTGFISDINYIDTAAGMTDTLRVTPGNYWTSSNNGVTDMGMAQTLTNGDFEKWADPAAGIAVDSTYWGDDWGWGYTYVFPMAIHPVTVPDTTGHSSGPDDPEHGPFCGPVGTEGCNAIAADSSAIVAWATGAAITRGPQMISNPEGPLADFGTEADAIGPASTATTDAVSLGDGGSALLTFATPIRNGEGPDFAVFENSFDDHFLELAFVEVSSDGQRFVRFPATSLTQTETQTGSSGSTDPTRINNLAGKFRIGYGTPFDLDELSDSTGINLDSIVYVRIVDVVGSIDPQYATYDAFGHIVNDPWPTNFGSCGFDLTGVAVLNEYVAPQPIGIEEAEFAIESVWPNPTADRVNVAISKSANAQLFDLTGRQLGTYSLQQGTNTIDLSIFPEGVYMLRIEGTACKIVRKR